MMITIADMFTVDFWNQFGDVDVYNDVTDEAGPALCGPITLTEEGKKKFEAPLALKIKYMNGGFYGSRVIVLVDELGGSWSVAWKEALELFWSAAGYCDEEDYNKWFILE